MKDLLKENRKLLEKCQRRMGSPYREERRLNKEVKKIDN
jgi:hypothetical protein